MTPAIMHQIRTAAIPNAQRPVVSPLDGCHQPKGSEMVVEKWRSPGPNAIQLAIAPIVPTMVGAGMKYGSVASMP